MRPLFMLRDMFIRTYPRILANKRHHDFGEHEHDSPKVNVCGALTRDHMTGPHFFAECTVTSHNYLDMLELFAVPQIMWRHLSARWCSSALCQQCYRISWWDISTALNWEGRMESMAPTLSRRDTPGFLFLGECEANGLHCSYL
jgi:hypothetical protein